MSVTVAPAPPKILSSNSTEFADYYLLHWTTNSRAPLKNVTVTISEISANTVSFYLSILCSFSDRFYIT